MLVLLIVIVSVHRFVCSTIILFVDIVAPVQLNNNNNTSYFYCIHANRIYMWCMAHSVTVPHCWASLFFAQSKNTIRASTRYTRLLLGFYLLFCKLTQLCCTMEQTKKSRRISSFDTETLHIKKNTKTRRRSRTLGDVIGDDDDELANWVDLLHSHHTHTHLISCPIM